jgi:hypothetical protein
MQTIISASLRLQHNPQIRGHRREQAFSSLKHERVFYSKDGRLACHLEKDPSIDKQIFYGRRSFQIQREKNLVVLYILTKY